MLTDAEANQIALLATEDDFGVRLVKLRGAIPADVDLGLGWAGLRPDITMLTGGHTLSWQRPTSEALPAGGDIGVLAR